MYYKKSITLSLMAVAMMLGLLCTNPCEAVFSEMLYGVDASTDGLSIYDPLTGAATFIARLDPDPNRFVTPIAMAVRPSDGTIYVWNNSDFDPLTGNLINTGVLLTVDPSSGLATEVNPLAPLQGVLAALAFTPDGRLFGLDNILVEIDPATGEFISSPVSLGLRIGGADSDASGMISGVELTISGIDERFVTIDPQTGVVTDIGTLSPEVGVIGSTVFDPAGNLIGSAFGTSLGTVLFDINLATGAVSNIRGTASSQGLGFVPAYGEEETPEGDDVIVRLHDRRKKAKKKAVRVKFKKVKKTAKKKKTKFKKRSSMPEDELPLLQFAVCTPADVFEIWTEAEFEPPVEVCIDYSDISCHGGDLRLLHKTEDGAWEDITTCIDEIGMPDICGDPDTLDICGVVESLSDFAVLVKKVAADDLDDLVSVSVGRVGYDRRTGQFSVGVTVTNTSAELIGSPTWLVIESISSPSVTVANPDGTTADGKPYLDLTLLLGGGQLDPGESVMKRVYFNNPSRVRFTFEPSVRGVLSSGGGSIL